MPSALTARRWRSHRWRRCRLAPALAALLLAAAWLLARAGAAAAAPPGPTFESGPCPFPAGTIPAGERVDCGNLVVPEDRDSADSPIIRLAVAILRTHNPAPAPDPIVFVPDGPGGSGLDWLNYFLTRAAALRASRDIILMDPRGTGYSQPSLHCLEFDSLAAAARARVVGLADARALALQTAAACHDRLAAGGLNLSAYTTSASAADVKDLRLALGYFGWNIYGVGYGTRVALEVLRDYPAGVRSVVLDGALPPQVTWWETAGANTDRAMSAFFASCARQAACAAAYPNLAVSFGQAADSLSVTPLNVQVQPLGLGGRPTPALVTGQALVAGAVQSLSDARLGLVPYLPLIITQLQTGNASVAEDFAQALLTYASPLDSGAWYSVQCHDEAPFADPVKVQANAAAFSRYRDTVLRDATLDICPEWGAGQAGASENQAVTSDVPALVLAGEFDPLEPPGWSQLAASTLSHSYYYLLGGVGHGASLQGCGQVLTVQFLENPALAPKLVCDLSGASLAYVTAAYLNPGVDRLDQALLERFDLGRSLPFLACALLFITALAAWPPAALFQKRGPRPAGFARWLASLTILLEMLFAAGLVALIFLTRQQQPGLLVFGLPPEAAPLFVVPWMALALTAGLVWFTVLAWKDGYWSLPGRVHFSLVVAAVAGFLWLLYQWGLLGGK